MRRQRGHVVERWHRPWWMGETHDQVNLCWNERKREGSRQGETRKRKRRWGGEGREITVGEEEGLLFVCNRIAASRIASISSTCRSSPPLLSSPFLHLFDRHLRSSLEAWRLVNIRHKTNQSNDSQFLAMGVLNSPPSIYVFYFRQLMQFSL